MDASAAVKGTIGLASEWGADAVTDQRMALSQAAGAVDGSLLFEA
jgi:hypothetical protein